MVTPYYNRPNRAGLLAHYRAVAGATDLPIVLYNIPQRTGTDMPNDLLAELAQIPNIAAVKQARAEDLAPIDGLDLLAGNDDMLGAVMDLGGTGGILVASHLVGTAMRRVIDEPDHRAELEAELAPLYQALSVVPAAVAIKAALGLLGRDVGEPRLPYVAADQDELATIRGGPRVAGPAREGLSWLRPCASSPSAGWGRSARTCWWWSTAARSSWSTPACASRRPTSWASTWCCPTSPTCASARRTSRRSC